MAVKSTKRKSAGKKSTAKKNTGKTTAKQAKKTPAKPLPPDTSRYCSEVVDGEYCNGVVVKSGLVHNKNSECYCTKCGRYYFKYTGRPREPKEGTPNDKLIEQAAQRDKELGAEIKRLKAEGFIGDEFTLRRQAHKNISYATRKETPSLVTEDDKALPAGTVVAPASSDEITDADFAGLDGLENNDAYGVETLEGLGDLDELDFTDALNSVEPMAEEFNEADIMAALDELDLPGDSVELIDTDSIGLELIDELNDALGFGDIEDGIVWDSLDVPVAETPAVEVLSEQEAEKIEQSEETKTSPTATVGEGMSFFMQKRLLDEEFPDIIEEVELETVVLKEPEPFTAGIADDEIDAMWTDVLVEKHKLTADDVKRLLVEESARLKVENFTLEDINFNPNNLAEDVILAEIRDKSITSLMLNGKPHTQLEIDKAREIRAKREADKQKAREEYIAKSMLAKKGLSFHFLSGEMTPEQVEEFLKYGLIDKKHLNKRPPSVERLHSIVNRKRILDSMGTPSQIEIPIEVVDDYVKMWESIAASICNKEYGEHSYWIAAGTSWAIPEFVDDIIKTGFATGLSVTPMITLGELKTLYERAHGYLNTLEFLAHSPKAMRDSIERFTMFNEAYKAVYEGATPMYKPKDVEPPKFTWESYAQSDIVIIQLPEVGLVTGGLAMLGELLRTRALARKSTILISTASMQKLTESNAGLVPALFGLNGISIVDAKDVNPGAYLDASTYLYYSIYDDGVKKGSTVQRRKSDIEAKNKKSKKK